MGKSTQTRAAMAAKRIEQAMGEQFATMPRFARPQPLEKITWVLRSSLRPNNYNPNKMPPPEFELLKISLLEDGWTQPIVIFTNEQTGEHEIVDGFHRWTVSADAEVAAMTGGLVPIVFIVGDEQHRMMSTIRHNRARGEHAILPMSEIVGKLLGGGVSIDDVQRLLQMEPEEVLRLAERAGMPEVIARTKTEFNKGWVPG